MKRIMICAAVLAASIAAQAQLLWKVTSPGSDKVSYIVGTHHLAPQGMIDSISGLKDAIKGVDAVYGEVDMTTITPDIQQKMMAMMAAPADSTLNLVLTKEQYDSVGAIVNKYFNGMATVDQLAALKPVALSTQLSLMQNIAAFPGFNPAEQLDTKIQQEATALGKQAKGFETIEFQLGILYGDPIAEQAEALMKTVRHDTESIELSKKLANAYIKGDLDEMYSVIRDKDLGMDDDAVRKLITDRNVNWASMLKFILPQQSVLVAVGAGHLPGSNGMISLLRGLGFVVEPVN
ncbi:MAG: TraB/GumN family protein [Muribaculaceae bacterium]|nr:TraB/GumN family protein [Muribaculaceae bacterium]